MLMLDIAKAQTLGQNTILQILRMQNKPLTMSVHVETSEILPFPFNSLSTLPILTSQIPSLPWKMVLLTFY